MNGFLYRQQKQRNITLIKSALEDQMKTKFDKDEKDKIQERIEDYETFANASTQLLSDIEQRKLQEVATKKVFNDAWAQQVKMANYIKIADEKFK